MKIHCMMLTADETLLRKRLMNLKSLLQKLFKKKQEEKGLKEHSVSCETT